MQSKAPAVPSESGFEFIDHPADVWVHAWGPNFEKAVEQCVYSLMETMMNPDQIEARDEFLIDMEEENKGALLIAFLSEFLFLFDTEGIIVKRIEIDPIEKSDSEKLRLHARAFGEHFDISKHEPDTEVKAITYSFLEINESENRTDIKIVFDI